MPLVALFRYDASPYSHKIDHVLKLKGISHFTVPVSPVPPRTDLQELGLSYRRIPVLLCDRDVYCDTLLIAPALERIFRSSPPVFPPLQESILPDVPLISSYSAKFERAGMALAAGLLPWERLPPTLVQDRAQFTGGALDPSVLSASRPATLNKFLELLDSVEHQLSDGRSWILNTTDTSVADISVYFIFSWVQAFKHLKPNTIFTLQRYPKLLGWSSRITQQLENSHAKITPIQGSQVHEMISQQTVPLERQPRPSHFDLRDAAALGVAFGDTVSVAPTDTGRDHPTSGRLIVLDKEEIVIEIDGKAGLLRCHFPRKGYSITPRREQEKPKL